MTIFSLVISHLPRFKIIWTNPILTSKLVQENSTPNIKWNALKITLSWAWEVKAWWLHKTCLTPSCYETDQRNRPCGVNGFGQKTSTSPFNSTLFIFHQVVSKQSIHLHVQACTSRIMGPRIHFLFDISSRCNMTPFTCVQLNIW